MKMPRRASWKKPARMVTSDGEVIRRKRPDVEAFRLRNTTVGRIGHTVVAHKGPAYSSGAKVKVRPTRPFEGALRAFRKKTASVHGQRDALRNRGRNRG